MSRWCHPSSLHLVNPQKPAKFPLFQIISRRKLSKLFSLLDNLAFIPFDLQAQAPQSLSLKT
jgi:hypothetical protein